MSIAANQQRTLLSLLATLRPHWRTDRNLPARIQKLLTSHRAFGSRDRRLYRELIYTTLRYLPWIEPSLDSSPDLATRLIAWLAANSPATAKFRAALLSDWPAPPASVAEKSIFISQQLNLSSPLSPPLPDWFDAPDHCPAAFESPNVDVLLTRAPLWLRLQTPNTSIVIDEFTRLNWRFEFSPVLPTALQLLDEVDVTKTSAYSNGLVEIQDLGSQLLLESAALSPGGRWLDACAGAGGKTLQLAHLLGPTAEIHAHDVRPTALAELSARAQRARIENIRILRSAPAATELYDGVLVDAPCSGSGTWRRAPHLKWTTAPADITRAAALQQQLLTRFAAHVRPGGLLLYATCSLSRVENESVVSTFLSNHAAFSLLPPSRPFAATPTPHGLTFLPAVHNTDGFFIAHLRRTS
jgi:tRNA and rRNA cytosine-C5-methylases